MFTEVSEIQLLGNQNDSHFGRPYVNMEIDNNIAIFGKAMKQPWKLFHTPNFDINKFSKWPTQRFSIGGSRKSTVLFLIYSGSKIRVYSSNTVFILLRSCLPGTHNPVYLHRLIHCVRHLRAFQFRFRMSRTLKRKRCANKLSPLTSQSHSSKDY